MKYYLVSEDEIEYLLNYISNHGTQNMIKSLIKSKKPVEVIASGNIKNEKDLTCDYVGGFMVEHFDIGNFFDDYNGKKGKLIFIENKE